MTETKERDSVKKGAKTGILAGLIASLCCIGPIIIILLGFGLGFSIISFALSFSKYKFYFLGASFLFIFIATILHLKQRSKACNINYFSKEGIKREKNFLITVIVVMVIIYFSMTYIVSPKLSSFLFSLQKPDLQKEIYSNNLRLLKLQINELSCPSCAIGLEHLFTNLKGVIKAKVYYPDGKAEIVYDPAKITKEKIISSQTLYRLSIVNDSPISLDVGKNG